VVFQIRFHKYPPSPERARSRSAFSDFSASSTVISPRTHLLHHQRVVAWSVAECLRRVPNKYGCLPRSRSKKDFHAGHTATMVEPISERFRILRRRFLNGLICQLNSHSPVRRHVLKLPQTFVPARAIFRRPASLLKYANTVSTAILAGYFAGPRLLHAVADNKDSPPPSRSEIVSLWSAPDQYPFVPAAWNTKSHFPL